MATPIPIRLVGSVDVIEEVARSCEDLPQVDLKPVKPIEATTTFNFGLVEIAALVAIVQGTVYLTEVGIRVYKALSKDPDRRIYIETPFRSIEIVSRDTTSQEEVAKVFASLAEVI